MQPILLQTVAFDAAREHVFQFNYSGDQAYKNRLIIRNNESNAVLYERDIATFQLKHALPAGSLTNSLCYNAQIQVLTKYGAESAPSRKIIFYCYTTPSFQFANVAPNQIIHNSSYVLQLLYAQNEGELLDSFQVYLYDSAHNEIHASGRYVPDG